MLCTSENQIYNPLFQKFHFIHLVHSPHPTWEIFRHPAALSGLLSYRALLRLGWPQLGLRYCAETAAAFRFPPHSTLPKKPWRCALLLIHLMPFYVLISLSTHSIKAIHFPLLTGHRALRSPFPRHAESRYCWCITLRRVLIPTKKSLLTFSISSFSSSSSSSVRTI